MASLGLTRAYSGQKSPTLAQKRRTFIQPPPLIILPRASRTLIDGICHPQRPLSGNVTPVLMIDQNLNLCMIY
ncbi:E3 ubiquitin-protein ligase [Fusarium oxysporum f. sp. albedinis]|nr:E3 ubiquitin-protein ligase [Fusarium oxysporum f. sp. albedinis]